MKKVAALFLFLLLSPPSFAQKMSEAELQLLNKSVEGGYDPYFVKSRDTVSPYGPNCITRDLLQDRYGQYWLATWKGIIRYDGKVFTNYTLKMGLIQFHVASCYEDKKGNLWFGTVRGGLYRYDGNNFRLFTVRDGLADNTVSSFAEDRNGIIWFATDKGISRYDGKAFVTFTVKNGLPSNKVNALLAGKDGRIWVGCGGTSIAAGDGGLVVCNPSSKTVVFHRPAGVDRQQVNNVLSLYEDKNGSIWIGKFDGLTVYNGRSCSNQPNGFLTYYFAGHRGNIWFTQSSPKNNTPNQVLYRFDGKRFTKILEKSAPDDCQIFGKIVDRRGDVWFGTMHGICRYDGHSISCF